MTSVSVKLRRALCVALVMLTLLSCLPAMAVGGSSTLATSGSKYVVKVSGLRLRTGAGTQYSVIESLPYGAVVTYYSMKNGWWYVRAADGNYGYLDKQFLAPMAQSSTGYYAVVTQTLNVRKEPKTSATKLGKLYSGSKVYVYKLNGDWGYVTDGKVYGWVALKYLNKNNGSTTGVGYRTTTALHVRAKASTNATVLATLSKGTTVKVLKVNSAKTWAYISYSKGGKLQYGYVYTKYLKKN